ncbi:MAG: pantoate kinase [Candidatus Odinarchaeia archaeon]
MSNAFSVFVPARISGFFEIIFKNNQLYGSTGAGPNLDVGGFTRIEIIDDSNREFKFYINGRPANKLITSINVLKTILPSNFKNSINIYHDFQVPIGCGYGASGAGALGLAIALNKALNLKLTANQIGRIAHKAEIISKTGLGTVGPQLLGGFVITIKGGPPGDNLLDKIIISKDLIVISATKGPIETKEIISDYTLIPKINRYGRIALEKLILNPTIESFLENSRFFAESTGLISEDISSILKDLDKIECVKSSICMVGKTVFTIVKENLKEKVLNTLLSYYREKEILTTYINTSGPILMEKRE